MRAAWAAASEAMPCPVAMRSAREAISAGAGGVQAGGVSAAGGSGVGLCDLLPSTATVELLANGLQFMQLSYTLLAQGAERMLESVPDFDMELTSPWTIHWSSWLGWMSVFNLDFEP